MVEQEWASQSTQILDFLPKLERSVLEMEKEKRGYLLTSEPSFAEAYKRAITDFYTYNGYLSILVASTPEPGAATGRDSRESRTWINSCRSRRRSSRERAGQRRAAGRPRPRTRRSDGDIRQMLADFEKNEVGVYETRTAAATRERIIKTSVLASSPSSRSPLCSSRTATVSSWFAGNSANSTGSRRASARSSKTFSMA